MSEQENGKQDIFWVKADYISNTGKNLAAQVPGYLRDSSFNEVLDFLLSNSELGRDEKKVIEVIGNYRQQGLIHLYAQVEPGKQKQCQLYDKVRASLTHKSIKIDGKDEEIELLEIIVSQSLLY